MINKSRINELGINPERVRELIREIEEQEVDMKEEVKHGQEQSS